MEMIPKRINSIGKTRTIINNNDDSRIIHYIVNEHEKDEFSVYVVLPNFKRPIISNKIVEQNNEFVNGYKVVKTQNGEYAYIKEDNNKLLPYRYDIAGNFNKYGFAMVAKDGMVSWINKEFKILSVSGEMVDEDIIEDDFKFIGFSQVHEFSNGDIPLSRVYSVKGTQSMVSYFGTDEKIKEFHKFDGKITEECNKNFINGSNFDELGYAFAEGEVLFAKGYYCVLEDLSKISNQIEVLSKIEENIQLKRKM